MAVDLYVGPLCRYYSLQWENPGQRLAREQGIPYRVVRVGPDGAISDRPSLLQRLMGLLRFRQPGPKLPAPQQALEVVRKWQDYLSRAFPDEERLFWEESLEGPVFTERPGWLAAAG